MPSLVGFVESTLNDISVRRLHYAASLVTPSCHVLYQDWLHQHSISLPKFPQLLAYWQLSRQPISYQGIQRVLQDGSSRCSDVERRSLTED